jgi:hypothetical protein
MKLYREVKASERLPGENKKVYTNAGLSEYCGSDNWMTDYPEGGFTFGKGGIIWWLEPIDITYEWLYDAIEGCFLEEEMIEAILSKLKGE